MLVTCDRPPEVFMRAYDSILNQTCRPRELVIVNAGTSELPGSLDGRVVPAPGANASTARNAGARCTTSGYIAFLDDDDEWMPDHLESHVRCLADGVGLVYSERTDIGEWDLAERNIMVRNWIGPTSFVTVSREMFDKVGGFDESFAANQEWDLWMRISCISKVVRSGSGTAVKHDSEASISSDIGKRISGWESVLGKHLAYYEDNPGDFVRVTKVFRDEMHAKRSVIGTMKAFSWNRRARRLLKN